jgi:probable phosphoglycerate mutase
MKVAGRQKSGRAARMATVRGWVPGGETVSAVAARADAVIDRVRHCAGNVLLFAHRDILRILTVRWLDMAAREGRRFYLHTGSVSILGYDHNRSEPVIRSWNNVPGERDG